MSRDKPFCRKGNLLDSKFKVFQKRWPQLSWIIRHNGVNDISGGLGNNLMSLCCNVWHPLLLCFPVWGTSPVRREKSVPVSRRVTQLKYWHHVTVMINVWMQQYLEKNVQKIPFLPAFFFFFQISKTLLPERQKQHWTCNLLFVQLVCVNKKAENKEMNFYLLE